GVPAIRLGMDSRTPTAMTRPISHTFHFGNSSISRWPAWYSRNDAAQRRLDDAHAHPVGDLDLGVVVHDPGHPAANAARGDDVIALLDRRNGRLMLLHPALLRTDPQHIEDQENDEEREGLEQN